MESNFWKFIKIRILGRIKRWKNSKRNPDEYISRLIESATKSDLVIDAGANIGLISHILLSHESPKVKEIWAFEPDPVAFSKLHLIEDSRLSKFNAAVWTSEGKSTLFRHKDWRKNHSHTSSSLIKSKNNVNAKNSVVVARRDLARVINISNKERITIKMDIEGAEYYVIKHLIKSGSMDKIYKIYCEFHPNSIRFGYTMHFSLILCLLASGNITKVKGWI